MTEYSFLDRVLHRAALQFRPIAELSFDLDQAATSNPQAIASERHVFVSGLARAGTTILMRRIYQSGSFCSLTYRNMPFVLAPNMWKKLTRLSGSERPTETKERAHGDRIRVNADSPESLDEVFWRVFDGENYIHLNHFVPHNPDQDLAAKYVAYVNAILTSDRESRNRYLSKNNNNLLRLKTIKKVPAAGHYSCAVQGPVGTRQFPAPPAQEFHRATKIRRICPKLHEVVGSSRIRTRSQAVSV